MKLQILYFASLREQLGRDRESLVVEDPVNTLQDLMAQLASRGDAWRAVMSDNPNLLAAINQETAQADAPLNDGDEVAFFPPVTGG